MPRGGNIQGVVHLQNQNYLGKKSVVQKVINGHKTPNDIHDEKHDEIKFYQGNSNRST